MAYILLQDEREQLTTGLANSLLTSNDPYAQNLPARTYDRNEMIGTLQHILMHSSDPDDLRNVLHDTLELLRTA